MCLVKSLPEKYEPVIQSLNHGKLKLRYDEVTTAWRSEEFRKMDREEISKEGSEKVIFAKEISNGKSLVEVGSLGLSQKLTQDMI